MAGTHYFDGKHYYADTAFLNASKGVLPGFSLDHMGFGEFFLKNGDQRIDFDRMRGKDFPGQSGRSHQVTDNQKGKLVKKLMKAMEQKGKSKLQTEADEFRSAGLTELQKLAGIRPKYRDLVIREAESPAMAAPPRPQGDPNSSLALARKLAGITPRYHAHLLDEAEQLGLPMNLGKRTKNRDPWRGLGIKFQPDEPDPYGSRGREPSRQAREANVNTFLALLLTKLIQQDKRDEKAAKKGKFSVNKYQLAHFMGALTKVRQDTKRYHLVGSDEAMNALLKSMKTRFGYERGKFYLPALNNLEKRIKKFMKDGKKPSMR